MALHVLDEANRCLGCKKPMCQQGCPIHTNIPEVIRLLKDNHLDDAGRMTSGMLVWMGQPCWHSGFLQPRQRLASSRT